MYAEIGLRNLCTRGVVGFNAEERKYAQDVRVNVRLTVDIQAVVSSEALSDSVNYRTLAKALLATVENSRPYSLERLAALLLADCFRLDDSVARVSLEVEKVGAIRYAEAATVGLEASREEFQSWRIDA